MNTLAFAVFALITSHASPAQGIETCSLLPQPDVEAAIGRSVPAGLKQSGKMGQSTYSHCTYKEGDKVLVLATVYTYDLGKAEVQKLFDSARKQAGDAETVSGLGDGAYWWKSKHSLFVIKGNKMLSLILSPDVAKLNAAKRMAERVTLRLPA